MTYFREGDIAILCPAFAAKVTGSFAVFLEAPFEIAVYLKNAFTFPPQSQ
jgi:hypothetical protein